MSMIGLLGGAAQAATAKSAAGDPTAAEGFGSTLQGALDALAGTAANHQGAPEALPTDLEQGGPGAEGGLSTNSGLSLSKPVELAETSELRQAQLASTSSTSVVSGPEALLPVPEPDSALATPESGVAAAGDEAPIGNSIPALMSAAGSTSSGVVSTPLTPLVETSAGNAKGNSAPPDTSPAATVVETPVGNSTPIFTSAASVAVPALTPRPTSPVAAPASLSPGGASTSSTNLDSGVASPLRNPTMEGGLSLSKPVEPAETTELRQAQQVSTSSTRDAAVAPSVAAPVSAPVGAPQPVAPAAAVAAPAAAASVPFATQLARPIFSLAAAGAGEHVMTVSVTPDNLGPVTVRAHVGAEGVRVELFAPNDLGRDAIRAIIPELRRDLAGAGLGGNLSLSPQNQPSADGSAHGSNAGQPGERDGRLAAGSVPASADSGLATTEQQVDRSGLFGTTSTIDVLA